MKRIALALLFVLLCFSVSAQEENSSFSFTGGMFVQGGMLMNDSGIESGVTTGLGGLLKFQLSEHFFLGTSGGTMKRNYTTPGSEFSYIDIGYGGLLGGWYHQTDNWRFSVHCFAGMGSQSQLHIPDQVGNNLRFSSYSEQLIWLVSPAIGSEFFVSDKIAFLLQMELFSGFYQTEHLFLMPEIRFGVLFNR